MYSENIMVSVIVITYNHDKYLRRALESILMQKVHFKYEVIVGEDCSPDNSREILKEYEKKYPDVFRMIYRDKNIGATHNFYDTLMRCRGKYIAYLEGDDYWTDENKLNIQVDFLENNPDYIGTYHSVNMSDNEGKILKIMPDCKFVIKNNMNEALPPEKFMDLCYQTMGQVFHIQSLVYRNIFLKDINCDKLKKLFTSTKYICDTQMKILVISKGKIKYIDKIMGNYSYIIQKDGTSFSSQNILMHYNDIKTVWKMVDEYFDYKYKREISKIILKEEYMVIFDRIIKKDIKSAQLVFSNDLNMKEKREFIGYFIKNLLGKINNKILK